MNKNQGLAYIVKYKKDAEFQVGYKGWQLLAKRAGIKLKVTPIYDIDEFSIESDGFETTVKYKANLAELTDEHPDWVDEHMLGVLVAMKEDGEVSHEFVTIGKIKQIAGISPSKKGSYSPYVLWRKEMYMGKAIKYVLSKTAMVEEIAKAVEFENSGDAKRVKDVEIEQTELTDEQHKVYDELVAVHAEYIQDGNNDQQIMSDMARHDCADWFDVAQNSELSQKYLRQMRNALEAEDAQFTEVQESAS